MSKIYNVRKAFQRIFNDLKEHEISCIFFNNDVKVMSTLDIPEIHVDHSVIFQTIQNIRCSSITDFSKIIDGYNQLNLEKSSLDVISVIISDGYHTLDNDTDISVDEITSKLEKKFLYSIGLGTDYDAELLTTISSEFHSNQTENMFYFLEKYFSHKEENFFIIEPDSFFVSFEEFHPCLHFQENESKNTLQNFPIIETDSFHKKIRVCPYPSENSNSISSTPSVFEKKHFLFIVDISGSMDDSFHSRIMETFYNDIHIYYYQNDSSLKKIKFYSRETDILLYQNSIDNNSLILSENDEIVKTCKNLSDIERNKDIVQLYQLYQKNTYQNQYLKKLVRKKYNMILSSDEKKLVVLLHNEIDNISTFFDNISDKFDKTCSICYSRDRNILLSCFHIISCTECTLKIIQKINPICPFCRKKIKWVRFLKLLNKCIKCSINIATYYQEPCGHLLFCSECFHPEETCSICSTKITSYFPVHFL